MADKSANRTSGHPDANQLAAFAEQRLHPGERQDLLAHLADCSQCREILALTSVPSEMPVSPQPLRLWWRLASAIAAVALIVAGTWGLRLAIRSPEKAPRTVAALQSAPQAITPAAPPAPAPDVAPPPKKLTPVRHKAAAKQFVAPLKPEPSIPPPPAAAPAPAAPATSNQVAKLSSPEVAKLSSPFVSGTVKSFSMTAATMMSHARTMWRVSLSGIERSFDTGKVWQAVTVPVDKSVKFQAIEADGFDVWAGGSHETLLHSRDGGSHWARVEIEDGTGHLTGSIVSIRIPQRAEIILETDSGEQWSSLDDGIEWRRL